MADADALLIRKLIVAALEGGDAHTDLGKAFGTRPVISFRYLAEERATGIFSGVSPAAHSLAAVRAANPHADDSKSGLSQGQGGGFVGVEPASACCVAIGPPQRSLYAGRRAR